jgi:hypothetical protein
MNSVFEYIRQLNNRSPQLLGTICLAILLIILVAGLWPFNFSPQNKVEWLQDRNGVHFYGQGLIISSDFWNKDQESLFADKSISLELWLRPLMETMNSPFFLTLYDGKTPDLVFAGQWKSHLIIRSRTDNPTARKPGKVYQEMGLDNALLKDQDVFVTITSGREGTAIYMNGRLAKSYPRHRLLDGYKQEPIRLILGNSSAGEQYWTGHLLGLAIYNRALASDQVSRHYNFWMQKYSSLIRGSEGLIGLYLFNERRGRTVHNSISSSNTLTIPSIFKPIRRTILSLPDRDFLGSWSFVQDVTINIVGFIQFGFFLAAFLRKVTQPRRRLVYMITAILGTGLSFIIELTQAYLSTRDSSLTDVLCNTAGTILGVVILHIATRLTPVRHESLPGC